MGFLYERCFYSVNIVKNAWVISDFANSDWQLERLPAWNPVLAVSAGPTVCLCGDFYLFPDQGKGFCETNSLLKGRFASFHPNNCCWPHPLAWKLRYLPPPFPALWFWKSCQNALNLAPFPSLHMFPTFGAGFHPHVGISVRETCLLFVFSLMRSHKHFFLQVIIGWVCIFREILSILFVVRFFRAMPFPPPGSSWRARQEFLHLLLDESCNFLI